MRYLSSISLALVVLMALACTVEPTPKPTRTPTLTESEAIQMVVAHIKRGNPIQYTGERPVLNRSRISPECNDGGLAYLYGNSANVIIPKSLECFELANQVIQEWYSSGQPMERYTWSEDTECWEWDRQLSADVVRDSKGLWTDNPEQRLELEELQHWTAGFVSADEPIYDFGTPKPINEYSRFVREQMRGDHWHIGHSAWHHDPVYSCNWIVLEGTGVTYAYNYFGLGDYRKFED